MAYKKDSQDISCARSRLGELRLGSFSKWLKKNIPGNIMSTSTNQKKLIFTSMCTNTNMNTRMSTKEKCMNMNTNTRTSTLMSTPI